MLQDQYRVIILKRSFSDTWRIRTILPELISYDIDKVDLSQPFKEVKPINAVIHTATLYGRGGEDASELVNSNTLFPLKLLEQAIVHGTKIFLNTDTFYNDLNHPYLRLAPYVTSKRHFIEWAKNTTGNSLTRFLSIKLHHIYGPKDNETKFIPNIIKACLAEQDKFDLTLGEQLRDFVYIEDVVEAYCTILNKYDDLLDDSVEVGSGRTESLRRLCKLIKELTNSKTALCFGALAYPEGEMMDARANPANLFELGWQPEFTLRKGLTATIRWYSSLRETNNRF